MADDLSVLFRLKGAYEGRPAFQAATGDVAKLRQAFGPQLVQTVTIANKAFSSLGDNLSAFVAQRVPLVGGALARVSDGLRGISADSAAAGSSIAALAGPIGIAVVAVSSLAVGVGLLGKAIFETSKATAEFQGKFFDLSQQVGVSVETLSTLDVIASTTGGNIESVTASMGIFQKALENAHDPTDKQAKLLKEIGVSALDTETALRQTLAGLFKLGEGAKQTDAVLQLFGRSGRFVNAILKESQGDLDAATKKFSEMGLVVSTEAAAAADQFNDSLELLGRQMAAITRGLVGDTIPVFTVFFQQINQSLTGNKDDWSSWSDVIKVEVAAALGAVQGFAQFVASLGNIPLGIAIDANIRTLLEQANQLTNKARFEADAQRIQRLTQSILAGRPGDSAAGGGGAAKAALANELEILQDAIRDREQAFQAESEDLRRELDKRLVDFQVYQEKLKAKNAERLKAALDDLEKERVAVRQALAQQIVDANEAAKRLRQIDNQERDIRRAATKEQQRLDDETEAHKRKQFEATTEVLRSTVDAQLRIAAIGDQQRMAGIRALAALRIKTEEDAEREILRIRLAAIDRERDRLNAEVAATASIQDPEEQLKERARLNLELRVLITERTAIEDQGERDVDAARQRDLQNERRYADELEDIRNRIRDIERDTAQEAIRLMVINFAQRKDIIRARLQADIADENARHEQALETIKNLEQENRESNRTQAEKDAEAAELNRLREAEAERHRLVMEGIKAQGKKDEQQATPLGRLGFDAEGFGDFAAIIGDAFISPIEALKTAFGALQESMRQFVAETEASIVPLGEILRGTFDQVADAIGQTVANWVLLGETGPAVMRKILAQALASIAAEAAVNAVKELALGFATLFFNPAESASHFTAAALWGSIAGVAAVAGRGVAGDLFKPKSSTRDGGGTSSQGPRDLNPITLGRNQPQPIRVVVVVQPDGSKFGQAVTAHILDDGKNAGPIREFFKEDRTI